MYSTRVGGWLGNCVTVSRLVQFVQFGKPRCINSIKDMPVVEICLIVTAVVIFSVANVIVIQHYIRGRKFRKKSEPVVYQPVEQDNMGHLYY